MNAEMKKLVEEGTVIGDAVYGKVQQAQKK